MDSTKKLVLARVRIEIPEKLWISEIFKKFSDVEMRILGFLPFDLENSIGNAIAEIVHYDIESIIIEIENHESVFEFNILERDNNRIKFNVKKKNAFILNSMIQCGVFVNFPIIVREQHTFWDIISSRKRIDRLLTLFEQREIEFSLLKIGNSPYVIDEHKFELSSYESVILEKALKLGFFEVPRNISLEELASKLGRSKSTISVILRKIIKKKVLLNS